jgi:hypothetical protein
MLSLEGTNDPMNEQKFGGRNHDIVSAEEVWSFVKRFTLPGLQDQFSLSMNSRLDEPSGRGCCSRVAVRIMQAPQ